MTAEKVCAFLMSNRLTPLCKGGNDGIHTGLPRDGDDPYSILITQTAPKDIRRGRLRIFRSDFSAGDFPVLGLLLLPDKKEYERQWWLGAAHDGPSAERNKNLLRPLAAMFEKQFGCEVVLSEMPVNHLRPDLAGVVGRIRLYWMRRKDRVIVPEKPSGARTLP